MRPIVFVGDTRDRAIVAQLEELGWGRVFIDRKPTPYPGEPWILDNGAFRDWKSGEAFDWFRFLETVRRAQAECPPPYFAIAPDWVGGGNESLWWSVECVSRIGWEWEWYLAVQDGMDAEEVEEVLPEHFAGLFLGGTLRFKAETAATWAEMARRHGKGFHYGRAGTVNRLRHAERIGAGSLDSAFMLWTRGRFDRYLSAWRGDRPAQLELFA